MLGGTEVTLRGVNLTPLGPDAEHARCGFGRARNSAHDFPPSDAAAFYTPLNAVPNVKAPLQSARIVRADPRGTWVVCAPTVPFSALGAALGTVDTAQSLAIALVVTIAPNGFDFEGIDELDELLSAHEGLATASTAPLLSGTTAAPPTPFIPVTFYVYPEPVPATLLPRAGPSAGGTRVVVSGIGFNAGPHFDETLARCRYADDVVVAVSALVNTRDGGGVVCEPGPLTLSLQRHGTNLEQV